MASSDINKVELIGNLGADPVLRYTEQGRAVVNLNVATTRSYKTKDGETHSVTKWHRVQVWGKQAEACAEYAKKGNKVRIEGHLEDNIWEGQDGTKHRDYQIKSHDVRFLDRAARSVASDENQTEMDLETPEA